LLWLGWVWPQSPLFTGAVAVAKRVDSQNHEATHVAQDSRGVGFFVGDRTAASGCSTPAQTVIRCRARDTLTRGSARATSHTRQKKENPRRVKSRDVGLGI
jgi:hypothetical protein